MSTISINDKIYVNKFKTLPYGGFDARKYFYISHIVHFFPRYLYAFAL